MEGSTESIETASDDEKPSYEVNIRDIVPRVDISPQITDALINELSDKDWKVSSINILVYCRLNYNKAYLSFCSFSGDTKNTCLMI